MEETTLPTTAGGRRGRMRALLLVAAKQRAAQALTLAAREDAPPLFAPYSPSPASVIDAVWARLALERISLGADELLVDLGCGDGRWLVSGVKHFRCRALGIELDPALVRMAKEKVRAAGLEDRIEIVEADILQVPIRAARLVIVYAFAESLHGIREYLVDQLGAHAFVLSIGFRVPDWKPRWADRVGGLRWYLYEMHAVAPSPPPPSVPTQAREHDPTQTITTTPAGARGAA